MIHFLICGVLRAGVWTKKLSEHKKKLYQVDYLNKFSMPQKLNFATLLVSLKNKTFIYV